MQRNLWIKHRKITRHAFDRDRGMERAYDPDLGLGKRVGYRSYVPKRVVMFTADEVKIIDYFTLERLIAIRKDAGLTRVDLAYHMGVSVSNIVNWERHARVCEPESRLQWVNACHEAERELDEWIELDMQIARVRADLTTLRLAQLMGERERDIRAWDIGGCNDRDIRARWAAICRNAFHRKQNSHGSDDYDDNDVGDDDEQL